ncbi:hypothetical protein [Leptospira langatensis]|uniref:hypothetical protein n=1 Tax=Leptospira langatensis TaxID=2484983 RepID=UPI001438441B|nr:hypothetical protein [Leptospira langatensis]
MSDNWEGFSEEEVEEFTKMLRAEFERQFGTIQSTLKRMEDKLDKVLNKIEALGKQ